MKFEFSVPMPYKTEHIDKIVQINTQVQKSIINNFYFCLPYNSPERTGFEQIRTIIPDLPSFENWKPLIEYSQINNTDIIYLLNSPKPMLIESPIFNKQLENTDKLINNLLSVGVNKVRITHPQLISYITKKYPSVEIYASTSLEYSQFNQYKNLLSLFPTIKQIVPAHDTSKNFKLLQNLKKSFPSLKIEIMVQEGCLKSCPLRFFHNLALPFLPPKHTIDTDADLLPDFFTSCCRKIQKDDMYKYLFLSNVIYPWQIKEYAKIGINQFKFVGRNLSQFYTGEYFEYYLKYLQGIDDEKNTDDYPIHYLINHFLDCNMEYTVKQVKPYLPKIEHFKKHGHLCASTCGDECNYCYKCYENFKKHCK